MIRNINKRRYALFWSFAGVGFAIAFSFIYGEINGIRSFELFVTRAIFMGYSFFAVGIGIRDYLARKHLFGMHADDIIVGIGTGGFAIEFARAIYLFITSNQEYLSILGEIIPTSFFWDLMGVAIGAFIGFLFAMLWDRKKSKDEEDSLRNKTIGALTLELKEIMKDLSSKKFGAKWIKDSGRYERTIAIIPISAFESAVNSGNFSLLSPEIQLELSELYQLVQYGNALALQIENFYSTPIYAQDPTKAEQVLMQMSEDLNKYYGEIRNKIGEALKILPPTNSQVERN